MRTFIALELGDALCARLEPILRRFARQAPTSRWVRPESLHLTLAFLGEVPDAVLPQLGEVLADMAERHPPHRLLVQGSGTFGPLDRPKVLWLGVSGELEALCALQRALAREVEALRLEPDHEVFVPHITLARAKSPGGDPNLSRCADSLRSLEIGELPISEVGLFASHTNREGMRYQSLVTHALRGRAQSR